MKSKKLIEKNYAFDKNSSKDRETKLQKQLADLYKENNDQGEEILRTWKYARQTAHILSAIKNLQKKPGSNANLKKLVGWQSTQWMSTTTLI